MSFDPEKSRQNLKASIIKENRDATFATETARSVESTAEPGNYHGNDRRYVGETHVYRIRGPEGTYKVGQSMPPMAHNRKLVLGGVALTVGRNNRHDISVMTEVRDELEELMIREGFLNKAPFIWVGLIFRYGLKNDDHPHYQRINKKHGDLPVAIELDTNELRKASREELKEIFTIATLKVLVHVGQKYNLPCDPFADLLRAKKSARPDRLLPGALGESNGKQ